MGTWIRAVALLVGGWLAAGSAQAADFTLRISTENTARHFQTRIVGLFAEAVGRLTEDRIAVQHIADARLFRDRDAIRAVQLGQVEMAAPGTWQFDQMVPDVGLFQLPMFYGRDADLIHRVADGPLGREISDRIADLAQVKVLGRWLDLGHSHIFKIGAPLRGYEDLGGLRIRVAGGLTNISRLSALGVQAFVIPWPDFPEALSRKTVDGTLTSFETIASARLWDRGLRSAFADRQYFGHYVPIVSLRFWNRLPEDLRRILAEAWEQQVDPGRALAAAEQDKARAEFIANGGTVREPSAGAVAQARARLLLEQDGLVQALRISPALVTQAALVVSR